MALALAACSSLPRPEKVAKPVYLNATVGDNETLGEYYEIIPSFKIVLPKTDPERLSYLESQVAGFNRMKLLKYSGYGADQTIPTNDAKAVEEDIAKYGRTIKVIPESLTISAKYTNDKTPRITVTASPDILDENGRLHFSLTDYTDKEAMKRLGGISPKKKILAENGDGAEAGPKTPSRETAEIRAFLTKKYGKTVKVKRGATIVSAAGKPLAGIDVELTFFPESARIVFNGTVHNLGSSSIWATYYLPHLTYHKGRDWYTFTSKQFSDSLSGEDLKRYYISPGEDKDFQFTTDPELKVLVYDAALKRIEPKNAFSSKEADDLLKLEMIEKYLNKSPDVLLEVFPDKTICADCGVKLY